MTQKEISIMNEMRREWIAYNNAGGKLTWIEWKSSK